MVAIPKFKDYWNFNEGGYCKVFLDGSNEWISGATSNQSYVIAKLPNDTIAGTIDRLMHGFYPDGIIEKIK